MYELSNIAVPEVEQVPVDALKTDGKNPNRMTAQQTASLIESIKRYGFIIPIVTNKNLLIADGEQRWGVAKELQMKTVPVVRLPVEDVDRRMLRQILNKIRGQHVMNLDVEEFQRIMDAGHRDDLKLFLGLDEKNLRALMRRDILFSMNNQNFVPAPPATTEIKEGDLFQCGEHRVMCGDATNPGHVQILLGDQKVDSLQTDPPFGVYTGERQRLGLRALRSDQPEVEKQRFDDFGSHADKKKKWAGLRRRNITGGQGEYEDIHPNDYKTFTINWLKQVPFNEKNTFYIWINQKNALNLMAAVEELGLYAAKLLVWVKNAGVLTNLDYLSRHELCLYGWKGTHKFYGKKGDDTFFVNRPTSSRAHPTMKPVELIQPLIEDGSDIGHIIYDPFGGSGTTLIAAEKTKRRCFIMEKMPQYVDVILRRYTFITQQKPRQLEAAIPCNPKN